MKFISKGAHSIVYEDGDTIIKKAGEIDHGYIKRQAAGYEVVKELIESGQDTCVTLPSLISIDKDKDEVTEKRINGIELTEKIYDRLSQEQKNGLARQMAVFLNSMHQLRQPKNKGELIRQKIKSSKNSLNSTAEFAAMFENRLPKETVRAISDAEQYILAAPTADEIQVMTHKDLRCQNILYDAKEGRLAVIDFEMAGVANIYNDFVPHAPCSITSWDFTKRIIGFYNSIPNKKYPMAIDIEKVRNTLIYGVAHELSRCLKMEKAEVRDIDTAVKKQIRLLEVTLSPLLQGGRDMFQTAKQRLEAKRNGPAPHLDQTRIL